MELQQLKSCYRSSLPINLPPEACLVYRSSNNMCPHLPSAPLTEVCNFDCDLPSQDVVIVGNQRTNEYILIGALTANRSLTYFLVRKRSGRLREVLIEQPDIKPDETPEQLMIKKGDDWRALLKEYGAASAAAMGVKPINPKDNLVGYCTWYYYYADVSEKNFLDNVDALAAHPDS
ncbi:MAG: hypothetical protein J6X55_08300, partial [Victivallales bacterium]|nr:hypothetical protein [Victivallales bacterium]